MPGASDDIQLEPPLARHPDVRPAVEDRSYIVFFAGALCMALGGGFLLAIVLSLLRSGAIDWPQDSTRLAQAHGWAQLQGWAGLFVAGMGMRLVPRFAGRRPIDARVNLLIFALLFGGAMTRTAAQAWSDADAAGIAMLAGSMSFAAGAALISTILIVTLARGRKRPEAWRYFAWAGALWWMAWAALSLKSGADARDTALIPLTLDETMTWVVMLGAIGNFIWSVQSRSVPVFFGRKQPTPARLAVPGLMLNAGIALVLVAWLADTASPSIRASAAGLALAGGSHLWLAPVAGAAWGRATRLRPRARAAARFVLLANIAAMVAGMLLLTTGLASLATGSLELLEMRDAARHVIGLGLITALIFGMAQLVAPVFALERAGRTSPSWAEHTALAAIGSAIVLRAGAALLGPHMALDTQMYIYAAAGIFAWLAVASFAVSVIRVVRKEGAMKDLLAAPVGAGE